MWSALSMFMYIYICTMLLIAQAVVSEWLFGIQMSLTMWGWYLHSDKMWVWSQLSLSGEKRGKKSNSEQDVYIILLQLAYVVLRTRIRLFSGEELHIKLDTIRTHDVLSAIERTKPSAKLLKDKYSRWQREYESVWCLCSWHTLLLTWCVCMCVWVQECVWLVWLSLWYRPPHFSFQLLRIQ